MPRLERVERLVHEEPTLAQEADALGEALDAVEVVRGEEDGRRALGELV